MEYRCLNENCSWSSHDSDEQVEYDQFQRALCADCGGFCQQDDDSELLPSEFLRLLNNHHPESRILGNVTQRQMVKCIEKLVKLGEQNE